MEPINAPISNDWTFLRLGQQRCANGFRIHVLFPIKRQYFRLLRKQSVEMPVVIDVVNTIWGEEST